MSIEAIDPAQNQYDGLVAGIVSCARRGKQLRGEITDLEMLHMTNTEQQISLSGELDALLADQCVDPGYRVYLKQKIAERIASVIYPELYEAGAEPLTTPPELYVVPDEG